MSVSEELASFIVKASYDDLSSEAKTQLKIRVLDSLGCAIGAADADVIRRLRQHTDDFGGREHCSLIGGGRSAPDRAAFYNSALIRYLDFNDSYLAKHETCHPSDNLGAILAASEYVRGNGKDLLTAMGVAYQVQCRLSDEAPVRAKGFDHATQGAYAVAAGASKALGLNLEQTVNALAISGAAFNSLRVTRTGALSNWKGLAYPNTAFGAVHGSFLAMRGITGPREVFEGNKGFMEAIAGFFHIDWSKEDMERVTRTILKKFNAEIHSQSALEGILDLKSSHGFRGEEIANIEVEVFDVAYHIIGGGEEGDKTAVHTKEEADHSLPYLIAVAALDGQVMPEQFRLERIQRWDVQSLLRRVRVRPNSAYSDRFPSKLQCRTSVTLHNGTVLVKEKRDYKGFYTNPMNWDDVAGKFRHLGNRRIGTSLCSEIIDAVAGLEAISTEELLRLLALGT